MESLSIETISCPLSSSCWPSVPLEAGPQDIVVLEEARTKPLCCYCNVEKGEQERRKESYSRLRREHPRALSSIVLRMGT